MKLSDFDFSLPDDLIAQYPMADRTASRLLHVAGSRLEDLGVKDLLRLVAPGDVLVFNNTRVIKARLYGRKSTGGQVEVLVERVLNEREVIAQLGVSRKPQAGDVLELDGGVQVRVLGREEAFFHLAFETTDSVLAVLDRIGHLPLPPYIQRSDEQQDETRYQTVYARAPGAVAAPTAGLHFDEALLAAFDAMGVERHEVTLHVGAGTFQPVRVDNIHEHRMHAERYTIPAATAEAINRARAEGRRVMAVGTTTLRALESAARDGQVLAGEWETSIFITPGYRFQSVDRLFTNFHLPKSTLMMLVSAFGGYDNLRAAYAHAVEARYRFFSYGDAMLLERDPASGI